MSNAVKELAERISRLETQVGQRTPQLASSSIEDGALPVYDGDGQERSSWGVQDDGTVTTTYSNGPTPGTPKAPTLTAHQLAVVVQWDGQMETGPRPKDLARMEVHVSESVDAEGKFTPTDATLMGTVPAEGGALSFAGDNDPHYVTAVAITQSGKRSAPSDFQSVTPLPASQLAALLVLASRIVAGDPNAARVELNPGGLEAYDASGNRTVYLDSSDGSGRFTGTIEGSTITGSTFRTAASGPRIEVNEPEPGGDQIMSYYTNDGRRVIIKQRTEQGPALAIITDNGDYGSHSEIYVKPFGLYLENYNENNVRTASLSLGSSSLGFSVQDDLGNDLYNWSVARQYGTGLDRYDVTSYGGAGFGWHPLNLDASVTKDELARIRRVLTGQIEIQCKINIPGGLTSNGQNIASLPNWAIPTEMISVPVSTPTGNNSRINITQGGNIQLWTQAGLSNVTFCRFVTVYSANNTEAYQG